MEKALEEQQTHSKEATWAAVLESFLIEVKWQWLASELSVKERGEHALEKQIQITCQGTDFQPQFRVEPTIIKIWLQ